MLNAKKWPELSLSKSLFACVSSGFIQAGPGVKQLLVHIIFTSILVAATKTPCGLLDESLQAYTNFQFFKAFLDRAKSMLNSIHMI
jgi:hypothetical protein